MGIFVQIFYIGLGLYNSQWRSSDFKTILKEILHFQLPDLYNVLHIRIYVHTHVDMIGFVINEVELSFLLVYCIIKDQVDSER